MSAHDPELTIRDADIETADLCRAANSMARLRKRGVCFHNSSEPVAYMVSPEIRCRDCGKVFPTWEAIDDERGELKAEYL